METITAEELQKKIENGEQFILLDVREPFEAHISDFKAESTSLPFNQIEGGLENLQKEDEYVVYCRSGSTSKDACAILLKAGFKNVRSLEGGINSWAKKIDPSLPQY